MRVIPGLAFTSGAFTEIIGAKDVMSISSCSSSADSSLGTPEAFSTDCSAQGQAPSSQGVSVQQGGVRVTAGTPGWGQGHCRDPARHRSHPSPRAAHHPSVSPKQRQPQQELGTQQSPTALPELQTYISPWPFSHSNKLLYKKLPCYWLDFASSSLIYSPRQMTAFPCPALR